MNKNSIKDYITTITILEHISDFIFILDSQSGIQYANSAAIQSLKVSMEELKGRKISDYLFLQDKRSADSKKYFENLMDSINQGIFNELEMELENRSVSFPVLVSFGLVKNAKQELRFIIVSAKDISIRKQLDKEIAQKKEITLSQNRIKSMGDLAVSLVHQLSQPLASIKLQIELTQKKMESPKITNQNIKDSLQKISDVADGMSGTLNNIRHFAFKVDDDSMKLLDLNESLKNALSQISYELQENEVSVHIESDKNMPFVSGVPINIEQVFVMLIKYFRIIIEKGTDKTTPSDVFIKLLKVDNKWVDVFISNEKNLINKRIEKRDIADVIYNMKVELSTIKAIIETMGGIIKVKKDEKENTCFEIRFPADEKSERDQLINLIELLHQ